MNDIAVSRPNYWPDKFTRQSTNLTQQQIQAFFESQNSILKNAVEIWRMDTTGNVYYTGQTIVPSEAIAAAALEHHMNPKVIIATLHKEASLVTAAPDSVPFNDRSFYYAMGYGATDDGDLAGTSDFDIQINKGAELLWQGWNSSPLSMPAKFPSINFGQTVTSGGVTYQNYIWVDNWGTWSLYNYTPHALDISMLPTIGGGNYLFQAVFSMFWGSNWDQLGRDGVSRLACPSIYMGACSYAGTLRLRPGESAAEELGPGTVTAL